MVVPVHQQLMDTLAHALATMEEQIVTVSTNMASDLELIV